MWDIIGVKITAAGYNFSAAQIENKYRGLERSYKRTKSHNKKTGRNKETCAFEK